MATGKTNIDKIIEDYVKLNNKIIENNGIIDAFDKMNESIQKTREELEGVNNSIFYMQTSLDKLNKLQEESVKTTKEAKDYAIKHKKEIELYQKTMVEINKLLKEQKKLQNKGKDLTNKQKSDLNDLLSIAKDLKDINQENNNIQKNALNAQIKLQESLNQRRRDGITSLDDANERWELKTKALKKGFNDISKGVKGISTGVSNMLKPWKEANDEAMKYARTMGMSQKSADAYLSKTVSWAAKNNIGVLFNKTTKELIQMQSKFSETLGRNVQLTTAQRKDMLAMEAFLGEDGMINMANNLENFGMGLSDSAKFVKKTFDEATKSGISASKLTKTIRENIKMAQNYSFKNGLDGLSSMAKKAIELKTDMSLINGFIDKTSTVEGAISTGANLQVLGGNYAMGSDPLSMMYESLNNVEGLFDRAVGMAQGKVFYNNKTGNFEMGAMDRYIMKQAATQMGVDPSKLIDVAFRKASLDKIEGQAKLNKNISGDKDMMEMVKNLATWDNGQAVVNINGQDKAVSALTKDDKTKLEAMQRTDSQNLQEMAINLRSINDVMTGVQKEKENEQAELLSGISEGINNWLKNSTGLLNFIGKLGAWGEIFSGTNFILGGIWQTVRGIASSGQGIGNLFEGFGKKGKLLGKGSKGGGKKLSKFSAMKKFNGQELREFNGNLYHKTNKGWMNVNGGAVLSNTQKLADFNKTSTIVKNTPLTRTSTLMKSGLKGIGKTALKGLKGGGAMAIAGAGISLLNDISSGEFKKDTGGSIGRAAGPAIGAIIGGIGGPIGAIIGGMVGEAVVGAVQNYQKKNREKVREEIEKNLALSNSVLSGLFSGDGSLEGNYSKKQLKELEEALKDRTISVGELSNGLKKKLKANGDYDKLIQKGVDVREMGTGGILTGNSHANGGMPILGSNITVEGGEFVVNKEATKRNLPLLNKINSTDYSFTSKEPLGKQMKVHSKSGSGYSDMPHNSKVKIDPISINLSGTIKLDASGRQFDISNEIINNPILITKLTEMINKELNILNNGAYNKNNFRQKFV